MRYTSLGVLLLLVGVATAEKPRKETPTGAEYRRLADEYDARYKTLRAAYKAEKNDDKVDAASQEYRAKVRELGIDYARRLGMLAATYPNDPAAVDALVRAVQLGGESPAAEKSLATLAGAHVRDARLKKIGRDLAYSKREEAEALLRAILDKNPDREARGQACHWLATRLRNKADDDLGSEQAAKNSKEAEALYRVVVEKYADVPNGDRGTLGDRAKAALTDMRRLAIGAVAPEIEGEDVAGRSFKLSDYRGKVVVLDFWGHWCPDCRAVYPQQRALVKRLQGKPFALVGVNSDKDKDALQKVLEKRGVSWRYWWDGGGTEGPISTAWNVQGWPTIYVLDHKGVIRHKGHEELAAKLDELVDALVKEAEGQANRK